VLFVDILIVDAYATACFGLFFFLIYIYRKFLAMKLYFMCPVSQPTIYHRDLWSVHFRVSPELKAENIITIDRVFTRDWPFSANDHRDLTRFKLSIYSTTILEP